MGNLWRPCGNVAQPRSNAHESPWRRSAAFGYYSDLLVIPVERATPHGGSWADRTAAMGPLRELLLYGVLQSSSIKGSANFGYFDLRKLEYREVRGLRGRNRSGAPRQGTAHTLGGSR